MKVLDIEAPANILALELMMSVHWGGQRGCERRDLRSDFDREYVCSSLWWGVVKSLAPIGGGRVVLVDTRKFGIKYKKPPRRRPCAFGHVCFRGDCVAKLPLMRIANHDSVGGEGIGGSGA
jgi:hypothetical protein